MNKNKDRNFIQAYDLKINGEEIEVTEIKADSEGNPRFVVHFHNLGILVSDYDNINKLYGFKKYRGSWFGGGVVFTSYNIERTLKEALRTVQEVKESNSKAIKDLGKRFSWLMPH